MSDFEQKAVALQQEAQQDYQEQRQEQEEFLQTVKEEEGADTLETECNIVGDYVVPLKAKLDGALLDEMGEMDARLERLQEGEGRAYEFGEAADRASQMLADVINSPEWRKDTFYKSYEEEGLEPLGAMLERAFESLKAEKERQEGAAEGFRAT